MSSSGFGAFEADLAVTNHKAAVAWYDTRHGGADIYLRFLDEQLRPAGREIRLSGGDSRAYEPDVAIIGNTVAVTWYEVNEHDIASAHLGLYDQLGNTLHQSKLSQGQVDARIPVLITTTKRLFIAWLQAELDGNGVSDTRHVMGLWLDTEGRPAGEPQVLANASPTTWNLNAAAAGEDRVYLVFDAKFETVASELYVVDVTPSGARVNRLTADDGYPSKYPDLAPGPESLALTWFDNLFGNNEIYLLQVPQPRALFTPTVAQHLELRALRVTDSEGDSIGAYLAWQGDVLALAWSEFAGGKYQVYVQPWSSAGTALAQPRRLAHTGNDSYIPSIAPFREGFAVAWNEVSFIAHGSEENLSRSEILVQRVGLNGM